MLSRVPAQQNRPLSARKSDPAADSDDNGLKVRVRRGDLGQWKAFVACFANVYKKSGCSWVRLAEPFDGERLPAPATTTCVMREQGTDARVLQEIRPLSPVALSRECRPQDACDEREGRRRGAATQQPSAVVQSCFGAIVDINQLESL